MEVSVVSTGVTSPCHRARSLVSQSLDGPLHELEERFLAVHLARCGACRAFQEDAEAFTSLLRSAPLEPLPWPVGSPARVARHRVHVRALAQIASVASVVIAAGTIALVHELPTGVSESSLVGAASIDSALADESLQVLRREALVQGELQILPESNTASGDPLKPALPVEGQ